MRSINDIKIMERSIYSAMVFAKYNYVRGNLNPVEYDILQRWNKWSTNLIQINTIIYLRTDPSVAYHRINTRLRVEEMTIDFPCVNELNTLYDSWLYYNVWSPIDSLVQPRIICVNANRPKTYVFEDIDSIIRNILWPNISDPDVSNNNNNGNGDNDNNNNNNYDNDTDDEDNKDGPPVLTPNPAGTDEPLPPKITSPSFSDTTTLNYNLNLECDNNMYCDEIMPPMSPVLPIRRYFFKDEELNQDENKFKDGDLIQKENELKEEDLTQEENVEVPLIPVPVEEYERTNMLQDNEVLDLSSAKDDVAPRIQSIFNERYVANDIFELVFMMISSFTEVDPSYLTTQLRDSYHMTIVYGSFWLALDILKNNITDKNYREKIFVLQDKIIECERDNIEIFIDIMVRTYLLLSNNEYINDNEIEINLQFFIKFMSVLAFHIRKVPKITSVIIEIFKARYIKQICLDRCNCNSDTLRQAVREIEENQIAAARAIDNFDDHDDGNDSDMSSDDSSSSINNAIDNIVDILIDRENDPDIDQVDNELKIVVRAMSNMNNFISDKLTRMYGDDLSCSNHLRMKFIIYYEHQFNISEKIDEIPVKNEDILKLYYRYMAANMEFYLELRPYSDICGLKHRFSVYKEHLSYETYYKFLNIAHYLTLHEFDTLDEMLIEKKYNICKSITSFDDIEKIIQYVNDFYKGQTTILEEVIVPSDHALRYDAKVHLNNEYYYQYLNVEHLLLPGLNFTRDFDNSIKTINALYYNIGPINIPPML